MLHFSSDGFYVAGPSSARWRDSEADRFEGSQRAEVISCGIGHICKWGAVKRSGKTRSEDSPRRLKKTKMCLRCLRLGRLVYGWALLSRRTVHTVAVCPSLPLVCLRQGFAVTRRGTTRCAADTAEEPIGGGAPRPREEQEEERTEVSLWLPNNRHTKIKGWRSSVQGLGDRYLI